MANFTAGPVRRGDLAIEARLILDPSGSYVSDWIDTSGYKEARLTFSIHGGTVPSVAVEEAQWDASNATPDVLHSTPVTVTTYLGHAQIPLFTRFFRIKFTGGDDGTVIDLTIRTV